MENGSHLKKNGSTLSTLAKWATHLENRIPRRKVDHTWRKGAHLKNGSHLKKWITPENGSGTWKSSHTCKNMLHLKIWIILSETHFSKWEPVF